MVDFNMASWNKVIRRDFFLTRPIRFLPEWPHEDVPVSCFMMLDATSLNILNRICYRYTIDRPGSAMGEARDVGQKKHFRILNSYRMVLDKVGERVQEVAARDRGRPYGTLSPGDLALHDHFG